MAQGTFLCIPTVDVLDPHLMPDVLQEANLTLIDRDVCQHKLRNAQHLALRGINKRITENMICAGDLYQPVPPDTCQVPVCHNNIWSFPSSFKISEKLFGTIVRERGTTGHARRATTLWCVLGRARRSRNGLMGSCMYVSLAP